MLVETISRSATLLQKFKTIRARTESICQPLELEDYSVQPVVDVSPPKWHLAHTTWFWEQFILVEYDPSYQLFHPDFAYLFNSYYNNAGERVLRPNRGLMTRPTVKKVYEYRQYVTDAIVRFCTTNPDDKVWELLEIGIYHEEQHQELLAYDIKYILGNQPTFPTYQGHFQPQKETQELHFIPIEEGIYTIGHQTDGFCFDNELGVHKTYIQPFEIANCLITNREYLEFIDAGGYQDFNLWHAEGWDFIQKNEIKAPLYWHKVKNEWQTYNYEGLHSIDLDVPVMHLSYYEAFAFAEWKGMRLPTEFEWEVASQQFNWGQLWEWTGSAYLPYPNFSKVPGALGEYNGKFMVSLHVLRGASVATPPNHSRHTYRNFFHPSSRWLFSGLRLVK